MQQLCEEISFFVLKFKQAPERRPERERRRDFDFYKNAVCVFCDTISRCLFRTMT